MASLFMRLLCLLPITSLAAASAIARNNSEGGQIWNGIPSRQFNPLQVPDYIPKGFAIPYNLTFCPAGSTQFAVPPIIAYYPHPAHAIFDIVGDYFNISWLNPNLTYTFTGRDNVPYSALRQLTNDPFAAKELLINYYKGDDPPYGFYHQQIVKLYQPELVAPGLLEMDSRPQFILRPGCGGRAAQFGWYFMFCFARDAKTAPAGFDLKTSGDAFVAAVSKSATRALGNVWSILERQQRRQGRENGSGAFNSTRSCDGRR